jgi:hypothetical protein
MEISTMLIIALVIVLYLVLSFLWSIFGITGIMGPSRDPNKFEKIILGPFYGFVFLIKKL